MIYSWGFGASGQLGRPRIGEIDITKPAPISSPGVKFTSVYSGTDHSIALDTLGRVWGFGSNNMGQLGIASSQVVDVPTLVPGLNGKVITKAAAGSNHTLLASKKCVYAMGNNKEYQLGVGDNKERKGVVRVEEIAEVKAVACGANYSLAVDAKGLVRGWGEMGQLGVKLNGTMKGRKCLCPIPRMVIWEDYEDKFKYLKAVDVCAGKNWAMVLAEVSK